MIFCWTKVGFLLLVKVFVNLLFIYSLDEENRAAILLIFRLSPLTALVND